MDAPVLAELEDVKMYFPVRAGVLQRPVAWLRAVDGVTLNVYEGEALGLVGESGCGKSTLVRTLLRLYEPTDGRIRFRGQDVTHRRWSELTFLRRGAQMVFQDPFWSLNPRLPVLRIVGEPLHNQQHLGGQALRQKVEELLDLVGVGAEHARRYPHEFSGGQQQRIAIARALAAEPSLLVLDEPTSAVDTLSQAQILNLLRDLQARLHLTYVMVSHDLAVVSYLCQRVAVMYLGQVVETGPTQEIFGRPLHPYAVALLSAVPALDRETGRHRIVLAGTVPSPVNPPPGCRFHTRCVATREICSRQTPDLREVGPGRRVACHAVGAWATGP